MAASGTVPPESDRENKKGPSHFSNSNNLSQPEARFQLVAKTEIEEMQYDLVTNRKLEKPSGVMWSTAMIVKSALGAGILSSHVAYKEGGVFLAVPLNVFLAVYLAYCLYILGTCAQILARRCHIPAMTYPDVGEAAVSLHPSQSVRKFAKPFRYFIDFIVIVELLGSCATYQLMIAKTVKQIVENTPSTTVRGLGPGYPSLRIYLLVLMVPCVILCLVRHLQWLAPVAMLGNVLVFGAVAVTIYYSMKINPGFENLEKFTSFSGAFNFAGMIVYSMSCCGVILSIENNMLEPHKFPHALFMGMFFIFLAVFGIAFFGYNAYLNKSVAPITLNFPMELLPKILKGSVAVMIFVTHGLNFWVPFNLLFHYVKKLHNPERLLCLEYIYRAGLVMTLTLTVILFPDVNVLISFIGCFCVNSMAFLCPIVIYLMVNWERPGLGPFKWRLIWCLCLLIIGLIVSAAGTVNSFAGLIKAFGKDS